MKLIKKNIVAAITPLFKECDMSLLEIGQHDVKVSPWNGQWRKDAITDLIKILSVIHNSKLINSHYEIWRQVGYYECTDDITMNFDFNKDELRKL